MKSVIEASPISQVPNALWHLLWGKMPNWYLGLGLFDVNLVSNLGGFGVCEDMRGCCPLHSEHISGMQCFDISFFSIYPHQTKVYKRIFTTSAYIFKFFEREPSQTILILPFRNLLQPANRSAKTMGTASAQHGSCILDHYSQWRQTQTVFFFAFLDGFCLATSMCPESPPPFQIFLGSHYTPQPKRPTTKACCKLFFFPGFRESFGMYASLCSNLMACKLQKIQSHFPNLIWTSHTWHWTAPCTEAQCIKLLVQQIVFVSSVCAFFGTYTLHYFATHRLFRGHPCLSSQSS